MRQIFFFCSVLLLLSSANLWGANIPGSGTVYVDIDSGTDNSSCGAASGASACQHLNYLFNGRTWDSMTGVVTVSIAGTGSDTSSVIIPTKTGNSSNNFIFVTVESGSRHVGVWNTGKWRLDYYTTDSTSALKVEANFVRLDGLQVSVTANTSGANFASGIWVYASGTSDNYVTNCLVDGQLSGSACSAGCHGIRANGNNQVSVWNNIVYGWNAPYTTGIDLTGMSGFTHSNTVVDCTQGIFVLGSSPSHVVSNNIVQGSTAYGYSVGSYDSGTNNLSNMADAYGTVHYNSQTVTFVGAPNYLLSSSDTAAICKGTNLSSTFTVDILGSTRPSGIQPWDLGAGQHVGPPYCLSTKGGIFNIW